MSFSLPHDMLSDLDIADLTFGSKNWDRRRSDQVNEWAATRLEHAAAYLVEDQMGPDREYVAGAREAVRLLRGAGVAVHADTMSEQRAGRVAASWLPKYTLARHARNEDSDA